jgi:hypothetical protein
VGHERGGRQHRAGADRVIAIYRKGRPKATNGDLSAIIATDVSAFATGPATEAERQAALRKAPVFRYYFSWFSPIHDGKLRSFHTLEIPFVFDHVDNTPFMNGVGTDRYAPAEAMSSLIPTGLRLMRKKGGYAFRNTYSTSCACDRLGCPLHVQQLDAAGTGRVPPPCNEEVGVNIDRFIGSPFQSHPEVSHGAIIKRAILTDGDVFEACLIERFANTVGNIR